ncbi:MAG: hypothetical protein AB1726_04905 [Planctomycetota bacterium]
MKEPRIRRSARGTTVLELVIVLSLFTVVFLSSLAMIESGRRFSSSTIGIATAEELAQQMLFRIEHELADATGLELNVVLTEDFPSYEKTMLRVDSTLGFPPRGRILLERGTTREERISYDTLEADQVTFRDLERGLQGTQAALHPDHSEAMWVGLAEPLELQVDPPAADFDGIANEDGRPVYFRGDGTGFAYRLPIDPTGGDNPLNGEDLFWGAEIPGAGPSLAGYLALSYEPRGAYAEADTADDLNGDGDTQDVFDVGQIRRYTWAATSPGGPVEDIGLGPMVILQEQGNWGGDLDHDGFDDPIFLWDKDLNLLHVRLFVLGTAVREMPIVREVESLLFLRNEPEL